MAKKKEETAKKKEETELTDSSFELEQIEQSVPKPAKKHYLRGLFVYGTIAYSDKEDAEFQMTDELAEQLVALNTEYKRLFRVWDGKEQ